MGSSRLAHVLRLVVVVGLVLLEVPRVQPAHAAGLVLTVDTLTDSASLTACTAAPNDCSLRGAIIAANTAGGPDPHTIRLSLAGVYQITVNTISPGQEDAAAEGDLDITANIEIRNTSGGDITVGHPNDFGLSAIAERVFEVRTGARLALFDLTVRGGNNTTPASPGGGGIRNAAGTLELWRVTVRGNTVASGANEGGGITNDAGGTILIVDSTIRDNVTNRGGGIYAGSGAVTLVRSLVTGNTEQGSGGSGILLLDAHLEASNTTFSGNLGSANEEAVGVAGSSGSTAILTHVTITDNVNGGLFVGAGSTATLRNTLIANQRSGPNCDWEGTISGETNLTFGDATCTGSGFANADPKFGPLQDNGGFSHTHALLPGSAAIDTGSLAWCAPVDQRGHTRPVNGDGLGLPACDIGAFELGGQPQKSAVIKDATWILNPTVLATIGQAANLAFTYGLSTDIPLFCDWDGDGDRTPGVFRNGLWLLKTTTTGGNADQTFSFGIAGDSPLCGDWNGDGIESVGVHRNGVFYLRDSNSPGPATVQFAYGLPTDKPVVGDWNGDLTDSIGVFRAGGQWYLRNANSTGTPDHSLTFGLGTDTPITGDWNGDGTDSIGVVRNGTWYLRNANTTGNADTSFVFGQAGVTPRVWR